MGTTQEKLTSRLLPDQMVGTEVKGDWRLKERNQKFILKLKNISFKFIETVHKMK